MSMGNGRGRGVAVGALALVAAACSSGAEDGRNPMGSQTMVTSADHRALYVAAADEGIVARLDAEQGRVSELAVDGEPTRVARIGDRVLVSLRTNGSILELRDDGGALSKVREVPVGTEPVGLVATEDGTRVYAAISTAGQVLELDGVSLATLRVWNLSGEPKWLGLHPGGEALYVAGTGNPGLFYINLVSGASRSISVPNPELFTRLGDAVSLSVRTTGDPAVSPKGNLLAVPVMFVDNTTPFAESSTVAPPPDDGYGGRMNPGMTLVPVDGQGLPKDEEARSVAISTFEVNGYPASALFSPDGELVVATIEGSAAIALFDPRKTPSDEFPIEPRGSVLEPQATDFIQTLAGPRAVAFTADRMASVFSFIDGAVTRYDVSDTKDQLDQGGSFIRRSGMSFGDVSVVSQPLPADVAAGRRLFYASNDTRMSSSTSGVSCATCHAEGRDDGLTWVFERGPRQTPSLAGVVSMR
ncbi:MAG: hypothetical protein KC933_38615, partial [Myxococcales bacterium]|nr:hypothetical protein [Myxococcales bacterium]